MEKGFEQFMKNPYWRAYYENAPSETAKQYIAAGFEKGDHHEEMKRLMSLMNLEDVKYMYEHSSNMGRSMLWKPLLIKLGGEIR